MNILQRLETARRVWDVAVPGVPRPADSQLVTWLAESSDDAVERVILRIPRRIRNWDKKYGSVNAVEVYKFVTASLNEMRQQQTQA